jgi:hypothetical protein
LGVSVAPSFFHTCVSEGKVARPEEVQKFKLATKIVTFFIEHFGMRNLFGRENYEYYARLTGRILKVEDEWIFFTAPWIFSSLAEEDMDASTAPRQDDAQNERSQSRISDPGISVSVDIHGVGKSLAEHKTASLEAIPENCPLDPNGRLSTSLDDQNVSSPSSCGSQSCYQHRTGDFRSQTLGRSGIGLGRCAESRQTVDPKSDRKVIPGRGQEKKSHTCLPQVHQRQTERMKHRSEWFLSDPTGLVTVKCRPDRPLSLDPAAGSAKKNIHHDAPSPSAMDISGSVSLPITSIGALLQHDTSVAANNFTSSTPGQFISTSRSPLPSAFLTATSNTPPRSRSPSNRLPIGGLIQSPGTGATSISAHISQPADCDNVPLSSTQSSIPPFMTFSSSRKLHQHFANQAKAHSAHPSSAFITPQMLISPSQGTNPSPIVASSGRVTMDQHSFLQSMVKFQSANQLTATQASISCGNPKLTQQLLPQIAHASDIPMSIPQPASTPTASATSRGSGPNNARLRRRLSDKDKERRLVRRSSSKRKDKENGGDKLTATSSSSLDKLGSSGAITTSVDGGESGPPSIGSMTAGVGGIVTNIEGAIPTHAKPRGTQLKRAGSADTGGANVVTGSTSPRNATHALLCRTGSQDNPHVEGHLNQGSGAGGVNSSAASPLTKSLPRI